MKIKTTFIIALAALIVGSCYYDNEEELYQNFPQDCDTQTLTYTIDIKSIVDVNCTVCHSPSGGFLPHLNTYQAMLSNEFGVTDRINRPLGDASLMPPTGQMNSCNIEKINQWYLQGALE